MKPIHPSISLGLRIALIGVVTITTTNNAGLGNDILTTRVDDGAVSFTPSTLASGAGYDLKVTVSISPGSNQTRDVQVTLTTDNAAVVVPEGATGDSLVLIFATGAAPEQAVNMEIGVAGETTISTVNDGGLDDAIMPVQVIDGFMFTITVDMREFTGPGQFPAILDAITATGGPGVFMVCPGDIDPPWNVDAALDDEFGANFDWYPIVGNHEVETPEDMTWIRNEFPNLPYIVRQGPTTTETTTYSWEYGNVHFAAINEYWNGSSDIGTDGDVIPALRTWLDIDLAANTKKWIFVTGHEPAYPQPDVDWGDSRHVGDSLDQYPVNRDAFWSLLDSYDVVAFLCGHTHRYSRYLKDDVWQVDAAQARGTDQYDTFVRIFVGSDYIVFHTYRSLTGGVFALTDLWTASLLPAKAANPGPPYQEVEVSIFADLSWSPVYRAISYDVYFGTDNPPAFQGNQTDTDFDPGTLQSLTPYYWRIDSKNDHGTTTGDLWTFSTGLPGDFDDDEDVDQEDFGRFQACYSGSGVNYQTGCEKADFNDDGDVDTDDYSLFHQCMGGPDQTPGC